MAMARSWPNDMDVRMKVWEHTLQPSFQSRRLLEWAPAAETARGRVQAASGARWPPWYVVAGIVVALLVALCLAVFGTPWSQVAGGRKQQQQQQQLFV
jgi:hypothetical protein